MPSKSWTFRSARDNGRALIFSVAAVGAVASGAASQQPQQPTFRAGVDLVRLDVRVRDAQGRPVKDLRRDEIEIVEGGTPHEILLFQHIDEPSGDYAEAAKQTIGGEVSTNRGAPRGHLYVLVFDQQHLTAGNEQAARLAAERFLETKVRRGDRVAIFGLPGPGPQLRFTGDVQRAVGELQKVRGGLERMGFGALGTMRTYEAYEVTRGSELVLHRVMNRLTSELGTDVLAAGGGFPGRGGEADPAVLRRLIREDARRIVARADEEARRFLLMLSDLMRELGQIEGRKAVILISEGFFTDNVSRELELAAAAAARTYSVVYALDVNSRDVPMDLAPGGGDQHGEIQSRLEPLGSLAVETDGLLVVGARGHVDRALAQIAAESQDYYIVGFAPSEKALKDRTGYRRVSVRVKRPGARASARTGYSMNAGDPTPADRRRAIDLALSAPFPQQGLPIEFTTYVLRGGSPAVHQVFVSLAAELPVASAADTRRADVVFAVRSVRDGAMVASGTDTMPLPPSARPGATTGTGTYRVQFEARPGEYLMRAVVREPGGLIGSADRRFEVRPLGGRDVSASDLILGSSAGGLPVRAQIHGGDVLAGAVELYASTPDRLENVDVVLDLVPAGAASATTSLNADLLDIKETPTGASRAANIQLPLEGIAPGKYIARARVRAAGAEAIQLARELEVLPGPAPAAAAPAPTTAPAVDPRNVLEGEVARTYLARVANAAASGEVRRAVVQAQAGHWTAVHETLAAGGDDSSASHALRGLSLFARGDFAAAIPALARTSELDPSSAGAAFLLGWGYAAAGRDRDAIGAWRNAARLDPKLLPAHLAIADALMRMSQWALARQAVLAGMAALPDSPELRDRLIQLQRP